jgi:hypothetical protein
VIFLIDYARRQGRILTFESFADDEWPRAQARRLEIELTLGESLLDREVVLLQAANEEALHLTHGRYFKDLAALVRSWSPGRAS